MGVVNVLALSLKYTYKYHFVSLVADRVSLKTNFFVDTSLPAFQRRINAVPTLWIIIQITLIQR